jgi:hypothetical protein
MTNSQCSREIAVMISSTTQSTKYSCPGSPLRLAKGSTAIDGLSGKGIAGADGFLAARSVAYSIYPHWPANIL